MPVWIGTSGWQYRDWRDAFYPAGLSQAGWLDHYAGRFATVEVNNTFYRLPDRSVFAGWAAETPEGFVVAPKASRYLSHLKRLKDPDEPIARFMGAARGLGTKLGPVLLQLPPNFHADLDRLRGVLARWPADVRLAVEFRHPSWFVPQTAEALSEQGAALCLADRGSRWRTPLWRTADWAYVRLHAGAGRPTPCYGRAALARCARDLAQRWAAAEDVFVYFNNDTRACAPRDARRFALACVAHGLEPTRVPRSREVRLA